MIVRKCAAVGCRKLSRPNGSFCSDACRARTWKANHPGYDPRAGRENAGERGRRPSRVSNGGLQVSVGRMLQVLQETPWVLPEVQARRAIARALSDKQRARFDHTPDPAIPGQLNLEGREAA